MRMLRKILQDGEHPIGKTRLHGIYLVKGLLWFAGFAVVGQFADSTFWTYLGPYIPAYEIATPWFVFALEQGWIAALFALGGFLIFAGEFVKFISTRLVVTTRRVLYKTGLIKTKLDATDISDILGIHIDQGWFGQFFGYGKLHLDCRFITDVYIPYIKNPYGVMNALEKIRKGHEEHSPIPERGMVAAPQEKLPVSQTLIQISGNNPVYIVDHIPTDDKTPMRQLPKSLGDNMISAFRRKSQGDAN